MFEQCGKPDAVTRDATSSGSCYVYRTIARKFGSEASTGSAFLVACTEWAPAKSVPKSVTTKTREETGDAIVETTTTVRTTARGKAGEESVEKVVSIAGTTEGPPGP